MNRSFIINIIVFLLIILFVYAAVSKLSDRQHFEAILSKMPLLKNMAAFIPVALPVAEFSIAALLFLPESRQAGLFASLGLMIVFSLYIAYMVLFARHLPCNCGGVLQRMNWKEHLVFNFFFIILSATGIKLNAPHKIIVATRRLKVQQPQGNR